MDLLEELKKICEKLDQSSIEYALCGGLALAVYAKPRATLDIDMMVDPAFIKKARKAVEELEFTLPSAPVTLHGGAVQIERLTKVDNISGEHLSLDFLVVTPETKKAWESRITVEWEGGILSVVSPQGLILLKSFRRSGQDNDDIEYLRSISDED